jgi:hypothetical protein
MDIFADPKIRYILIGVGAVLAIALVATLLLPRKARIGLYIALILGAAGAWAYVTLSRDYLPSDYGIEPAITAATIYRPTMVSNRLSPASPSQRTPRRHPMAATACS